MKKDLEIQKNVMEELKVNPLLKANEIGVAVKNGIVTLSGTVDSYPKKIAAERSVKKVKGVRGIAEDLDVRIAGKQKRSDSDIAQAVINALEWHSAVNIDRVDIIVEDAVVTLEGEVDWDYQRQSARSVTENTIGVKKVINNIRIAVQPQVRDIKKKIQGSFLRNAIVDSKNVNVETIGNKVILTGKVNSWTEAKEAEECVWSTPGVSSVENKLFIDEEL